MHHASNTRKRTLYSSCLLHIVPQKRTLKMYLFFIFVTFLALSVKSQELSPKNMFLLAGQSNMAGRGGIHNVNGHWNKKVPPESSPNPSILQLSLHKTWVIAHEPLHKEIDKYKTCGVGPGMAFAHEVLTKDPSFGVIGLVPCAIGGTKIIDWAKGSRTGYYKHLVERANASLKSGGTIKALLWYQGESDTQQQTDAKLYKRRLKRFFTDVRADLNSPKLPIIQVWFLLGKKKIRWNLRQFFFLISTFSCFSCQSFLSYVG
jgi:hypothetical protein